MFKIKKINKKLFDEFLLTRELQGELQGELIKETAPVTAPLTTSTIPVILPFSTNNFNKFS